MRVGWWDDMKIGDKVWVKSTGRTYKWDKKEYIITKIGRKYLEVNMEGYSDAFAIKFDMSNDFRHATNYSPDYILYFSLQDILDEEEYNLLLGNIRKLFGTYGKCKLSLEQLRQIDEIIKDVK